MRRYIVVVFLAFFWVGSVLAAPVSPQVAGQVARNVFLSRHPRALSHVDIAKIETHKWQKLPVIHAINFQQGGFVLLSADDRARPVLGICYEGRYDPTLHVPGFDGLLEEWSRQIHHIVRNRIPATAAITQEWAEWQSPRPHLTASAAPLPLPIIVPPLLSTTWNQGCHYNANCPVDGGGACSRVWTGCGATAMAQCMKYNAWPTTGISSYSYTPSGYPLQSANYGATTYNWAAMPNNVSSPNPAVAQLMSQCGIALDMNYGTTESTCYFSDLGPSFKRYFRYSLSTQSRSKLVHTDAQWDVVLRTELNASRVVPYNGGPHIWVCDGYQTGPDLYHMNWGWGGVYNGYYAQNNLNPGGLSFSTVSCIVGLKPVGPFEVEGDSAVFGENAGNTTVEVAGDSNWVASSSAAWIGVSLTSGTEGYFQPVISVPANPGYSQRFGYVAFQRGLLKDTVRVRQAGITPRLSAGPATIVEGAAGGSRIITVNCDSNWVVTFADAWISYAPALGVGNGSVGITIANNPGAGSRIGIVAFSRGSLRDTVFINQDGTSAFWCVPVLGPPTAVGAINVQVKTLNRTSGISEGYVLAPDSTIFRRDSTYTLRVTFSGSVAPAVWVDWNQDGDFFDASEAIVAPGGSWYPTFGGTKTVSFLVPSTATLGQTRMRVYVKSFPGPTTGPCATASVGDIEDFNVYIQPASVLPAEDFVLTVDDVASRLEWTWGSAQDPAEFHLLLADGAQWQTIAELDGGVHAWQPLGDLQAGQYQAMAISMDGSRSYSNVVEYSPVIASDAHCVLSPNPVSRGGTLQLQFPAVVSKASLRILDMSGKLIRQDEIAEARLCYLSTEGWTAGVYFVQVRVNGKSQTLRLVVE